MRDESDAGALNLRLLVSLLAASVLLQVVVPLARIATSYRAVELGLNLPQIGALSSAFALLPVFLSFQAVAITTCGEKVASGWPGPSSPPSPS